MKDELGLAGKLARAFIDSRLTPLVIAASLLLGLGAVMLLPREEEPQIIVPMIDVFVQMPGASAKEVEERVSKPMEKLLWEVPGVEYIYSTSSPGYAMAVVRFYVGQNEEASIVRLNQKMSANFDLIPPGASLPIVKPRSIDDVPILALTLSSNAYDHSMLRRVAAQMRVIDNKTVASDASSSSDSVLAALKSNIRCDRPQFRSTYSGTMRGGPRLQLLFEPGACQMCYLLQRSRFLKEVRGSRHDRQLLLATDFCQFFFI